MGGPPCPASPCVLHYTGRSLMDRGDEEEGVARGSMVVAKHACEEECSDDGEGGMV